MKHALIPAVLAASLCACVTLPVLPPEASVPAPASQPLSGFPSVKLSVVDRTRGLQLSGPPLWNKFTPNRPVEATVREAVEEELRALRVPVTADAPATLEVGITSALVQWPPGFGVTVETMIQLHAAALDGGNSVLWQKGEFVGGTRGTAGAGCCGGGEANRGLPQAARIAAAKLGAALDDAALLQILRNPSSAHPRPMAVARAEAPAPAAAAPAAETAASEPVAAPAAPPPSRELAEGPHIAKRGKHARVALTLAEAERELLP